MTPFSVECGAANEVGLNCLLTQPQKYQHFFCVLYLYLCSDRHPVKVKHQAKECEKAFRLSIKAISRAATVVSCRACSKWTTFLKMPGSFAPLRTSSYLTGDTVLMTHVNLSLGLEYPAIYPRKPGPSNTPKNYGGVKSGDQGTT